MKYEVFCGTENPLTFTEATVYAPLILISILYLPTMIYVILISIRFYGFKKWISEIINEPVYFIFPILTSLSFYGNSAESNFRENLNDLYGAALKTSYYSNFLKCNFMDQHCLFRILFP